jgi:hypothetical protein
VFLLIFDNTSISSHQPYHLSRYKRDEQNGVPIKQVITPLNKNQPLVSQVFDLFQNYQRRPERTQILFLKEMQGRAHWSGTFLSALHT